MAEWLASAASAGIDPAVVVPTPMLLPAPLQGFVRHDRGDLADYRSEAAAFSLEPELASQHVRAHFVRAARGREETASGYDCRGFKRLTPVAYA